ncbi:hypothetical protein CEXT_62971 [Caerostris extrusa]|uniref:Uncharacterized protein n=1 Tax=Caerostris extrusa TaxID=172846 RepID=A0AAV4S142_CAEEX|nr:hypothetical protein CEXT_62971 [Caerostris extrusa]
MLASHRGKHCGLVHKAAAKSQERSFGILGTSSFTDKVLFFIRCEREIRTSPSPKGKYGFGAAITGAFAEKGERGCFVSKTVPFYSGKVVRTCFLFGI